MGHGLSPACRTVPHAVHAGNHWAELGRNHCLKGVFFLLFAFEERTEEGGCVLALAPQPEMIQQVIFSISGVAGWGVHRATFGKTGFQKVVGKASNPLIESSDFQKSLFPQSAACSSAASILTL